MFWADIWKNIKIFIWKFTFFLVVKFSVYLNRRVFVMHFFIYNFIYIWKTYIERVSSPSSPVSSCTISNWKCQNVNSWTCGFCITKTHLFKYTENFTTKNWKFSDKNTNIFFHISARNIDCGYSLEPPRRGAYNEYPQSMFLSRSKKNNVYPCKPQFYYIKVGFKGVKII